VYMFELYLKRHRIRYVLCRVGYPQTNGKLGKFRDLYNNHRFWFEGLETFVVWYNNRPYGAFNLWEVETSEMVFVKMLWSEVWLGMLLSSLDGEIVSNKTSLGE